MKSTEYNKDAQTLVIKQVYADVISDITTPLNVIALLAETALLQHSLAKEQIDKQEPIELADHQEIFGNIITQTQRITNAITQLTQLTSPHLFENHEPTDVNAVLKAVVQLKKGKSRSENISLQLQFCDGLPLVDIDIIYLQLIVLGIIDDAFSALGELDRNDSKRYVKLQTKLHDNRVIIDITNNGNTAINSKNQTRIFNNLFAIKGNKKLGLKLSAFRSTLRQHRGDLELISVKNDIITFRIYLPITEV